MAKPKRCRHSKKLETWYGYAYASGWVGIGACFGCTICKQVLWFEDDQTSCFPEETSQNDKKRQKNRRYGRRAGMFPKPKYSYNSAWEVLTEI